MMESAVTGMPTGLEHTIAVRAKATINTSIVITGGAGRALTIKNTASSGPHFLNQGLGSPSTRKLTLPEIMGRPLPGPSVWRTIRQKDQLKITSLTSRNFLWDRRIANICSINREERQWNLGRAKSPIRRSLNR